MEEGRHMKPKDLDLYKENTVLFTSMFVLLPGAGNTRGDVFRLRASDVLASPL